MEHADNISSLFIDTNLDTRFATVVSHSDTISDLKRKIMLEHHQCFPAVGDIKIDSLKVKRRGHFYHLSDSMLVKSAFATVKDDWFLSVDASRLALPCAIDNRSTDQGSPSSHLTIVPAVNHVVSILNQFTTGNSHKDYQINTKEDRPFDKEINSKKRTLMQSESLVEDASGVEKKHKTEEKEASVQASQIPGGENIRTNNENSTKNNIRDLNDESTRLNKGEKCSGLDQETTVVSSSIEDTGAETLVQKNTEASETILPDVFMVLEKNIEQKMPSELSQKEKGEFPLVQNYLEASETVPAVLVAVEENIQQEIPSEISQKENGEFPLVPNNSEASETVPAVLMAVEDNIQQEIPSEIAQKAKENALVKDRVTGNEIPSSVMRTSDCELDDSEIRTLYTILKDGANMSEKEGSTVQESAGDQIDYLKEDKESSRKEEPEVKLPRRKKKAKKSAERNKDESAKNKVELEKSKDDSARNKDEACMERADNTVSEISSIVPAAAHQTETDKVSLSNAEKNEVLEKALSDDVTMQEVEISQPSEVVEETSKEIKDAVERRKKKKDVGRSATRNDAATVANKENVGGEESRDMTLIAALLVDGSSTDDILANNDAEVSRTEKNDSQGNDKGIDRKSENQNEKMDGEKREKRKKKTKKSAKNGEGGMSTKISDPHLSDHLDDNAKEHETTLLNAARNDGDEVKGRDAQVFDVGLTCSNTDQFKTPKEKSKVDALRISKSDHANKAHGEPSAEVFLNQKSDKPRVVLGLASVKSVQKSSGSGTIFGGDSGESPADVNALPGRSSSSADIVSSIDSRTDGSHAVKRNGGGGNSLSKSKNISMTDRLRSSSRLKRPGVTASQEVGDTESEPVEFVPESPPMS